MKRILLIGIGSALALSGCQTNPVMTKEDASNAYFSCLNKNYNAALGNGLSAGGASVDAAIQACESDAMNYAFVFARKYHEKVDKHYEHASSTYKPIIEKTTRTVLLDLISEKNQ